MKQILNDFETARGRAEHMLQQGIDGVMADRVLKMSTVDSPKGWRAVRARRKHSHRAIRWAAAASVLLLVGAGVWLLHNDAKDAAEPQSAMLILPSGEKIDLGKSKGVVDAAAFNEENTISYSGGQTGQAGQTPQPAEPVWHTLEVPQGGDYKLRLADGSLVHLNSMSAVRFPVAFTGRRREVELLGEAWFEVEGDAQHPFVVHTKSYDVEVVGTKFNVSSYGDDRLVSTTLAEGVVRIGGVTLSPNEQYSFDVETGQGTVESTDAAMASAWRTGRLVFRDQRLEDIMRTLGRWYGVQIEYADPAARQMRFGMSLTRQPAIDPLLAIIEENGRVSISKHGNTIIININPK